MAKLSMGTLYDVNKSLMEAKKEKEDGTEEYIIKPLTHLELAAIQKKFENFFNWRCDNYGMLYCKDKGDFTIFHMYENQNPNPPAIAAKECLECCINRGDILSIEEQPDKNYEIWIRIDGKAFVYYLFPYDNAVIEC